MKKLDAFAVFFLYIIAYFAFGDLAAAASAEPLALQCAFTLTVGAIPFFYAALRRIPFGTFFHLEGFSWMALAGSILCMAGASILAGEAQAITAVFAKAFFYKSPSSPDALLLSCPLPLAFLASAILPAICEETLFRGFILGALRKSSAASLKLKDEMPAILLASLLFAAAHGDPLRLLPSFISGVAISAAACLSGSLLVPMAMHCFNNSAALILIFAFPEKAAGEDAIARLSSASILHAAPLLALQAAFSCLLVFAGVRIMKRSLAVSRFFCCRRR